METNCKLTIIIQCMVDSFLFVLWEGNKLYNYYTPLKQMHVCIECWDGWRNIQFYKWYSVTGIIRLACFPTGVAPHFSLTFTFRRYHTVNTTVCCTKEVPEVWYCWKVWFHEQINSIPYNKHNCVEQSSAFILQPFPGFSCVEFNSWKTLIDSLWNWIIAFAIPFGLYHFFVKLPNCLYKRILLTAYNYFSFPSSIRLERSIM